MDFLTNILTTEDRDKLLYEIELFKRRDYGNIRQLSLDFLKASSDLKSLQKELLGLVPVGIVLAFSPTPSVIDLIFTKLKKSIEKQIILDISVDEKIIGGLILIYKGKYQDLSVLKAIT